MKKLLSILTLLMLVTFTSKAQFSKGTKFVEGTASYYDSTGIGETYSINPTIGYFVNDKVAIGATANFGKGDLGKISNIGVFGRIYFLNIGKNFKTFTQLTVLSSTETKTTGDKLSGVNFNAGLGINYFVTSRLALSAEMGSLMNYNGAKSEFEIGFKGLKNPLTSPTFGVLYTF